VIDQPSNIVGAGFKPAPTMLDSLKDKLLKWILAEIEPETLPPCDFEKIKTLLKPGDVLLVQGLNRFNDAMSALTQSRWTHAALCIGHLSDVTHDTFKEKLSAHLSPEDSSGLLLIEGVVGKIVGIVPLNHYQKHYCRICRPKNISLEQRQKVMNYAMSAVGYNLETPQLLQLLKILFLWMVLPRAWFVRLHSEKYDFPRPKICSCLLAEAFSAAKFPILPDVVRDDFGQLKLVPQDPRLFYPAMFDDSPYFETIKYLLFDIPAENIYRGK
jgi:hypothetical protein